jgi:hypothetical protein
MHEQRPENERVADRVPPGGRTDRPEVVERAGPGFDVVKRRWVVERDFAWPGRNRRPSKDHEGGVASSEAFAGSAMVHLMARRLVKNLDLRLSHHALRKPPGFSPRGWLRKN